MQWRNYEKRTWICNKNLCRMHKVSIQDQMHLPSDKQWSCGTWTSRTTWFHGSDFLQSFPESFCLEQIWLAGGSRKEARKVEKKMRKWRMACWRKKEVRKPEKVKMSKWQMGCRRKQKGSKGNQRRYKMSKWKREMEEKVRLAGAAAASLVWIVTCSAWLRSSFA